MSLHANLLQQTRHLATKEPRRTGNDPEGGSLNYIPGSDGYIAAPPDHVTYRVAVAIPSKSATFPATRIASQARNQPSKT